MSQVLCAVMEATMAENPIANWSSTRYDAARHQTEVTVIIGAQWGDEGKGRMVDFLCQRADVVCRCQVRTCVNHPIIFICHRALNKI